MSLAPIEKVVGRGLPLIIDDMDTDRIIPARFLRRVTFDGLGDDVFCDERFDTNGEQTDFPMNHEIYKGATIILGGSNFGCGSSREHAPQAIKRAGFKAIIAESFAEIFFGNSLTIGLPCIVMAKEDISKIARHITEQPNAEIFINFATRIVHCYNLDYSFSIPEEARLALINGRYDLLAELKQNEALTEKVANTLTYR